MTYVIRVYILIINVLYTEVRGARYVPIEYDVSSHTSQYNIYEGCCVYNIMFNVCMYRCIRIYLYYIHIEYVHEQPSPPPREDNCGIPWNRLTAGYIIILYLYRHTDIPAHLHGMPMRTYYVRS